MSDFDNLDATRNFDLNGNMDGNEES